MKKILFLVCAVIVVTITTWAPKSFADDAKDGIKSSTTGLCWNSGSQCTKGIE